MCYSFGEDLGATLEALKVIAHADWGSAPKKRWMCIAEANHNGRLTAFAPEPVGNPATLLRRLIDRGGGRAFVGFDFPIGVPAAYARSIGTASFTELLRVVGTGPFVRFFDLAETPADIAIGRPFYPKRPGNTTRLHLIDGLGVSQYAELLRRCDAKTKTRNDACSLFWTLGGQQVGRAAIIGWRDVLRPALLDRGMDIGIWPFDGDLQELLTSHQIVVAETYPAEAALHIGLGSPGRGWSKRSQVDRIKNSGVIERFAARSGIIVAPELQAQLVEGFGASKDGEDPFDATIGLLSMIAVVKGLRPAGTPPAGLLRSVEGWILGQEYEE